MPEAVKEVQEALPIEKKEVEAKPNEGCSGTLPADDKSEKPVEGTKPEEGLEADQPPISVEQPATEEKPTGSVAQPQMNGKEKDPLEAGDAPAVNGAEPEGALQNGSGSKEATPVKESKDEKMEEAQDEGSSGGGPASGSQEGEAGASGSVSNKEAEEEIKTFVAQGKMKFALGDYDAAAELLGKACEVAASAYGELSHRCGDLYFDYGCALLECGKNENTLLGEGVKEEVKKKDDDEEEEEILPQVIDKTKDPEEEKNGSEMEVDSEKKDETESEEKKEEKKVEEKKEEEKKEEEKEEAETKESENEEGDEEEGDEEEGDDEETTENKEGGENEEEDESSLKVAWEVFELAKLVYTKYSHKNRLIETYLKLGEVNFESGNIAATEDMLKAIEIQTEVNPDDLRGLSHSHFQIGLTLSTFEKFEEAANHFKEAKKLLLKKIDSLSSQESEGATAEKKEIEDLLPDLDEKIADMEDSLKEKLKEAQNGEAEAEKEVKIDEGKPAANISHLIKRKRKIDEIASEIQTPSAKQPAVEEKS